MLRQTSKKHGCDDVEANFLKTGAARQVAKSGETTLIARGHWQIQGDCYISWIYRRKCPRKTRTDHRRPLPTLEKKHIDSGSTYPATRVALSRDEKRSNAEKNTGKSPRPALSGRPVFPLDTAVVLTTTILTPKQSIPTTISASRKKEFHRTADESARGYSHDAIVTAIDTSRSPDNHRHSRFRISRPQLHTQWNPLRLPFEVLGSRPHVRSIVYLKALRRRGKSGGSGGETVIVGLSGISKRKQNGGREKGATWCSVQAVRAIAGHRSWAFAFSIEGPAKKIDTR